MAHDTPIHIDRVAHQHLYVIEGSGAILTDEGELAVTAGDLVDLARGSSRGMQARSGRMVVLAIAVL